MTMNATTARQTAIKLNDARLDGRITRDQWVRAIAVLDAEMAAAGITWEEIQ